MAKAKINNRELAQETLSTILNDILPLADSLQELGHPLGEYLINPNLDLQSKLDAILKLSCGITLESSPADNGTKRTQEQWFNEYWNTINDGRVMASMGDLYRNFKAMKKVSEQGTVDQKKWAQALLTSLRNDFDWQGKQNWLVSSTQIEYAGNKSLDAEIIHHYNRPDLIKRTALAIPVYRDVPLTDVVADQNGLRYVQVLLDTNDSTQEIIDTLQFVGNRNDVRIWSADTSGKYPRNNYPSRAAGFNDNNNLFHVSGDYIDNHGRSRGVVMEPAGRAVK